ncbi:hypothetical protein DAPPUDRAFT_241528 [Daphnia pulex]|uniref:Uncharacterized protein n=1 Tax=Daphnia pulex TaxID=6669 RepID=E9GEH6_DAPPU|nr:hypothetical protein DAPPUDRAFT_241528 [Daphnia pulex]|eukprot:EFX82268.1 hypothetical protein DAPPUDRAFT_241528 [Daphnia pulex]
MFELTHPQQRQPSERKRPVSMAFRIKGHEKHYVKLACGGLEVGPIPQQRHLQKERLVCISIEGHGDHFVKGVMQWCRGWVRTGLLHHYLEVNYGVLLLLGVGSLMSTTRENLTKGKEKGNGSQSSEHLRPYSSCILRRITRSQSRLNHQGSRLLHHNLCCSSSYTTKTLKYYTIMASETTQLRMLPQPTTPRLQLIAPPKLSEYYTGAPKYDRSQSSELLRHPTRQPRSFE